MTTRQCQSAECICKRRILVVENRQDLRTIYQKLLIYWGYEVVLAEGRGEALMDDAIRKAHEYRCHVALVDKRLRDDRDQSDQSGLELVPNLKPARSIIVTGYGSIESYREAHDKYGAFGFFSKKEGPETLHTLIRKALDDTCVMSLRIYPNNWLQEQIASQLKSSDDIPIDAEEIKDILAMLFPRANDITLEQLSGSTRSPIGTARRRSTVFKATVDNLEPVVIKLATADKIKLEVTKYEQYVKGKLGGHYHAQVESHKRLWNIGGIAYTFIGDSEAATTFSEFYNSHPESQDILKPLKHFFDTVWRRQYTANPSKLDDSLFDKYDAIWDHALSVRLEQWQHLDKQRSFPGIDGVFPEPRFWLYKRKDSSKLPNLRQCVIHGDLHADNLFADKNGHAWVVDFEHTGLGHMLQDFAHLESSILLDLLPHTDENLIDFYELCVSITALSSFDDTSKLTVGVMSSWETRKAIYVINELRKIARDATHLRDTREYLWAMLMHILYKLVILEERKIENQERWSRALLGAAIICERLDRWGDVRWPPSDWPTVNWDVRAIELKLQVQIKNYQQWRDQLILELEQKPDKATADRVRAELATVEAELLKLGTVLIKPNS